MYDIITIGSATRDIFARAGSADIHPSPHSISGKETCLPLGAKIDIAELTVDTGGGATNTAVSFSHFGMRTAPICRVGYDLAGEEIKKILRDEGVDTRLISAAPKIPTASSIILISPDGDRTILVYRGASGAMNASSIPWNKLRTRWLYISSLGGNVTLLARLLEIATRHGIKVGWNPGGKEISMGIQKLSPFIRQVDVLIMNEEEAIMLVTPLRPSRNGVTTMKAFNSLRHLPRRALAITQGARGALTADAAQILQAPAIKKKVINTTGAGDAFSAGFITGLWKWNDLSLALRLGILNSGMCVTKMGAKNGLLPRLPSKKRLLKLAVQQIQGSI